MNQTKRISINIIIVEGDLRDDWWIECLYQWKVKNRHKNKSKITMNKRIIDAYTIDISVYFVVQ